MYEKYSGLPDTTKATSQSNKTSVNRADNRSARDAGDSLQYVQYSNHSSSQTSRNRAKARKAKARKRKMILLGMGFAFLALIVVLILVLAKGCAAPKNVVVPESGTFRSGVSIDGMDVSGKTPDEVRPQLESNEAIFLERIAITLSSSELNATITGADMKATTNLDDVMQQALAGDENQSYSTAVSIDDAALSGRIDAINQTSSKPPVNASVTMNFSGSGKPAPQYNEGTPGFGLDVASTIDMVKQALAAGQYQTTLTPQLTSIPPAVTVADVRAKFAEIGTFQTTYDFKGTAEDTEEQRTVFIPNRAFNVEKAAAAINQQVVKPGESWSFNDVVGDRTQDNGWELAQGIFGGDRATPQYGGGVCQVSTTLYNALLQAYPYIEIVDRHHHSYPSTYVEKGLDATVDTNHIDFVFKNISEQDLYIYAYSSENKMNKSRKRDLTVVIYGQALPAGHEYKTRTVLVSEEAPGPDEITETKKLFVGQENILAPARQKYIVDVYIDHYVDGVKTEEIYRQPGPDVYPGNPLRKQVGIMPTPTPEVAPTPAP